MPLDWELRERRAEEARLGLLPPYSSESPLFFFPSVLRRGSAAVTRLPDFPIASLLPPLFRR